MMRLFRVVSIGKGLHAPSPTFVSHLTAYYARAMAAVFFRTTAMDIIMKVVDDDEPIPKGAVQLVSGKDGGVSVRPFPAPAVTKRIGSSSPKTRKKRRARA